MTDVERHRALLYGRIAGSLLLYLIFVVLALASVATDAIASGALWIVVPLGVSVILLPRRAMPTAESTRGAYDDSERERLERVGTWLMWTRLLYLAGAAGVLLLVPQYL